MLSIMLLMPVLAWAQPAGDRLLTTPPLDTADAERIRIWVPVERSSKCRMDVDIYDDSGKVIRQLVDDLFGRGYYNFWWDKKDDSGNWVDEGIYAYVVNSCGIRRDGNLQIAYVKGERTSRLIPQERPVNNTIDFELTEDSLRLTIDITNFLDEPIDRPIVDSIMTAGVHSFNWQPGSQIMPGRYKVRMKIGEFEYQTVLFARR